MRIHDAEYIFGDDEPGPEPQPARDVDARVAGAVLAAYIPPPSLPGAPNRPAQLGMHPRPRLPRHRRQRAAQVVRPGLCGRNCRKPLRYPGLYY